MLIQTDKSGQIGYFQKPPTGFFFLFYILILFHFFEYETIVRRSAWYFGLSDLDPSSVNTTPLPRSSCLSGGMLQFLSCMETSIESIGGKFDPSLSTVQEEEDGNKVSSADPSKAKRRFPWTKKEVRT